MSETVTIKGVDRCYRENGPSRLVRTLAPTAAHQNLALRQSNEYAKSNELFGRSLKAFGTRADRGTEIE